MKDNPHAIVEINGFRWDSFTHPALFQKVSVELATGEASMAAATFVDLNFRVINQYAGIAAGATSLPVIRVWLGYGNDTGEPVFKGLMARVERGMTTTTFRAYDMSYRMRLAQKAEHHKGDDFAIMNKLITRNQLQFKQPAKPLKLEPHKAMTQDFQTDWQHLAELAHDGGLVLWTRGDTVFADYPAKVGEPKITLAYKKDFTILRDFDLQFKVPENVHGRPKGIEVRGRRRGGKRLTGQSDEDQRGRELLRVKRDLSMHTQARATRRAQAQKELDREHAFEISISQLYAEDVATRPDVRDTIRLQGLGKLFSGDYLADRVAHEFSPGRLSTQYGLYRDVKEN